MVTVRPGGRRRIDRVLDPEFVAALSDMSLQELRDRRALAMQEEADLSYVRRMLQGRIELLEQGVGVKPDEDDGDLVARLTRALVGTTGTSTSSRHLVAEPSRMEEHRRYEERLISDVGISNPESVDRDAVLARLRQAENELSDVRRSVHEVIDAFTDELTTRLGTDEA